jgi:spermidine synthase
MTSRQIQRCLYLIFALSGSTGLIYESVWSHYLKLFLGHAAYAQCLVLIIFMGGMALGAWTVSRIGHDIKNLLLTYAIVEGIIGIFGLVFHFFYELISSYSFESIIPVLGSPLYVDLYKLIISSLLILPQSILLGATFPLMSGGFIRKFPDTPGKSISLLYFSNSIGAAVAVLISSFYLIRNLGLPGTIFTAALINIFLAILVYGLVKGSSSTVATPVKPAVQNWQLLLLGASFFTGMASFIYEVAWIRMLSMVLGASTHSFELMLSAFITGLGIGGYWINKRIDKLQRPLVFAAGIQILMGLFALSTVFLYNFSFEIMSYFMAALKETEQGYMLFSLASHSIALLIMLPTTICAGMTLPLFTFILIRQGGGESSIGQIYSSNTIGAIVGVVMTVFVGMPVLTLKGSILTGALIDIFLGLVLIKTSAILLRPKYTAFASVLILVFVLISAISIEFNPRKMASGVFRHGVSILDDKTEILFHEDGKAASVSVTNWDNKKITIITNGKPDAAITMGADLPPSEDESTMVLLAALPLSVHPNAENIANIGLGSGMTAHVALASPNVKRIDTIEIEEAIIKGARYFGAKTEKIFNDPRSHIIVNDAKTFFFTRQIKYDLVISEPSNPWVSGVSSLFTREFYRVISRHLNTNGLLVQWIHIYEFNIELLISVLKAISSEFPFYSLYFADDGNLILLASNDQQIDMPGDAIFSFTDMKQQLSSIHINNLEDIRFRFLGDQSLYQPFIEYFNIPPNSDYYPYLDLNATKARFMKQDITDILDVRFSNVPILDIFYENSGYRSDTLSTTQYFPSEDAIKASKIFEYFSKNIFDKDTIIAIASINYLQSAATNCNQQYNEEVWADSMYYLISKTILYLTPAQLTGIVDSITPICSSPVAESYLAWIGFFRALIDKNHENIIRTSKDLLMSVSYTDVEQKEFLLITLLTALLKIEANEQAAEIWTQEIRGVFADYMDLPLEIQLLLARVRL